MSVPSPACSQEAEMPARIPISSCGSLYASNHSSQSTMCAVLEALSILGRETARIVLHASCVVCDRELPWRDRKASCCAACWSALPKITGAKCDSCALPWSAGGEGFRCIACLDDPLPVGWTEAWGQYRGSLERLLHAFKFERHDFLDAPLAELLESVVRDVAFDAIVPVPMHRS